MVEKNLIYELKIPIDFTCRPGGGIDVHYITVELPEGVTVKSAPSVALNCWQLLPNNVMVQTNSRTIDRADTPVDRFTIPDENTVAGQPLGYLKANYQDSLFKVNYSPYLGVQLGEQQTVATKTIQRMTCSDGRHQ
jgi:hypothetical protein